MVKNTKKNNLSIIILQGEGIDKSLYKKCLDSVKFADEIVVVKTVEVKGSFSEWRNEGLLKAKGDWVLYVDTDEIITTNLQEEIKLIINNEELIVNAYAIPRKNYIFGKEFKYSGQYPDYQKRLFKKDCLKKWTGDVHEEPVFSGGIQYMNNSLAHYKNMTISQMLEKTNKWSEIEADLMIEANHPPMNFFRFFSAGFREFVLRFVKQKAFMDGKEGVIYGIYQIYSRLISYAKLWEKQQSTILT